MTDKTTAPARPPRRPSGTTKKARLVRKLQGPAGADLAALAAATGWQAHTVRAALTRLRQAGYEIARFPGPEGKPSRYRIVGTPPETTEPGAGS